MSVLKEQAVYGQHNGAVISIGHKNTHIMDIREHEHFKVLHANTNRLQGSSIIYMQNQLNNKIKKKKERTRLFVE